MLSTSLVVSIQKSGKDPTLPSSSGSMSVFYNIDKLFDEILRTTVLRDDTSAICSVTSAAIPTQT